MLFGHNLTPTTSTLKKNVYSVGSYAMAFGLTDRFTIATSPWLYSEYNMYSAIGRYSLPFKDAELGTQLAYFKTDRMGSDFYQMEAVSVSTGYSWNVTNLYRLTLSGNYMYFFDETIPFSLRREPYNNQPFQLSLSTLHEGRFSKTVGFAAELGVLGINYSYPQAHFGASVNYKSAQWVVQAGYSQTLTLSDPSAVRQQAKNQRQNEDGSLTQYQNQRARSSDFSLHPEFQVQYFF